VLKPSGKLMLSVPNASCRIEWLDNAAVGCSESTKLMTTDNLSLTRSCMYLSEKPAQGA
jgi:hypothetical protein